MGFKVVLDFLLEIYSVPTMYIYQYARQIAYFEVVVTHQLFREVANNTYVLHESYILKISQNTKTQTFTHHQTSLLTTQYGFQISFG